MNPAAVDALRSVTSGRVVTDPDVLAAASHDQAPTASAGRPSVLVRATDRDDVVGAITWALEHGVAVVPQGARTGLSGGANATDGCLLLDVSGMNRILEIDPVERIAVVEPGVLNGDLSDAVRAQGLFYPPDPASWRISTVGGNVATNAGGLCCVKYGVTKKFVRALEVVLADGRVLHTGTATAKGVAGYDLTGLFVGSEGTLGIITQVTVSLIPAPDEERVAVALFDSAAAACTAATQYLSAGGRPSMLEFMDGPTLELVQRLGDLGIDPSVDGLLLVGCDDALRCSDELAAFAHICEEAGAETFIAEDAAESEQFTQARRLVGPAHEAVGTELVDDVCVPLARTGDLVVGVRKIAAEHDVTVTCAGHLGDGNMHPTVLYRTGDSPETRAEAARAGEAFEDIMRLGLSLGGTISGEHGIGRLKAGVLPEELGDVGVDVQRRLRATFDPTGVFNPEVALPLHPEQVRTHLTEGTWVRTARE